MRYEPDRASNQKSDHQKIRRMLLTMLFRWSFCFAKKCIQDSSWLQIIDSAICLPISLIKISEKIFWKIIDSIDSETENSKIQYQILSETNPDFKFILLLCRTNIMKERRVVYACRDLHYILCSDNWNTGGTGWVYSQLTDRNQII